MVWKVTYNNYRDAQSARYSEMFSGHLANMVLHDRILYFESNLKYKDLTIVVNGYGHVDCIELM